MENESEYSGTTLNGLKHGKGILEMSNFRYEGEFYYDKLHGKGKLEEKGLIYFGNNILLLLFKKEDL